MKSRKELMDEVAIAIDCLKKQTSAAGDDADAASRNMYYRLMWDTSTPEGLNNAFWEFALMTEMRYLQVRETLRIMTNLLADLARDSQ